MIDLQNKRECFFDSYLIDESQTTAERRLHKPIRRGVLLKMDKPWEGKYNTFFCVVRAEEKFKMYYVAVPSRETPFICYAESDDGENWVRPNLGIVEFKGSTDNNIIMDLKFLGDFEFTHFDNMSVFYDENPACPPNEKYKMTAAWIGHAALIALFSEDGIHFTKSRFITDDGAFDSQNRAFYSKAHQKYFCYYRGEHDPAENVPILDKSLTDKSANPLYDPLRFLLREPGEGTHTFMRDIRVIESKDFVTWNAQQKIETSGTDYQLYNNVIFPYPRAEHMIIGFPLRYAERKQWTKNYDELCGKEARYNRMTQQSFTSARQGLAITDGLFMCSRDGYNFTKYDEALLPPPPENPESFVYGDGTAVPALIEVPSDLPGAENEYMIIVRENFRTVTGYNQLAKYTIRLDGFVSLHAGSSAKKIFTKPFTYTGKELYANLATSGRGSVYFTLSADGEEYTSVEVFGNSTDKRIRFEDDEAVARLSGKTVTLTAQLFDADLYAIRFE